MENWLTQEEGIEGLGIKRFALTSKANEAVADIDRELRKKRR